MPAATRTCTVCGGDFYGRTDAAYCSTACRQKAYRARTRTRYETVIPHVTGGPVPDGDDWMAGRFHGLDTYIPIEKQIEFIEANYKTATAGQRHIAKAGEDAALAIRSYVEMIASISIYDNSTDTIDYDTPLGDSLPANIAPIRRTGADPLPAAELASMLRAALPRVHELLGLLVRRAREI
jgi:hypothetical protein